MPDEDRSIALVGLMGAGKSSVGRMLAERLGLPFVDSDEEVERAAGLDIADIFARRGEDGFRDAERRIVAGLVERGRCVIATGGGAFVDDDTRALILERCVAVWLDADVDTLAQRVGRREHRPLLAGKDPRAVLAALAERRNPVYAQAHIAIRSAVEPHAAVVDQIVAALVRQR